MPKFAYFHINHIFHSLVKEDHNRLTLSSNNLRSQNLLSLYLEYKKYMSALLQYITIDKEIVAGVPVFKGTRVAVKTLFDYLEDSSLEEFLKGFPTVSRVQAEAVIEQAATLFLSEIAA
jgi:uncharacterized protein (DUF433 family)